MAVVKKKTVVKKIVSKKPAAKLPGKVVGKIAPKKDGEKGVSIIEEDFFDEKDDTKESAKEAASTETDSEEDGDDVDNVASIGHNRPPKPIGVGFASEDLRNYIERVERLEGEKSEIAADIKDVYSEAKANGFDIKIMRKIVSLRKLDRNAREEMEALLDTYQHALGMKEMFGED